MCPIRLNLSVGAPGERAARDPGLLPPGAYVCVVMAWEFGPVPGTAGAGGEWVAMLLEVEAPSEYAGWHLRRRFYLDGRGWEDLRWVLRGLLPAAWHGELERPAASLAEWCARLDPGVVGQRVAARVEPVTMDGRRFHRVTTVRPVEAVLALAAPGKPWSRPPPDPAPGPHADAPAPLAGTWPGGAGAGRTPGHPAGRPPPRAVPPPGPYPALSSAPRPPARGPHAGQQPTWGAPSRPPRRLTRRAWLALSVVMAGGLCSLSACGCAALQVLVGH